MLLLWLHKPQLFYFFTLWPHKTSLTFCEHCISDNLTFVLKLTPQFITHSWILCFGTNAKRIRSLSMHVEVSQDWIIFHFQFNFSFKLLSVFLIVLNQEAPIFRPKSAKRRPKFFSSKTPHFDNFLVQKWPPL